MVVLFMMAIEMLLTILSDLPYNRPAFWWWRGCPISRGLAIMAQFEFNNLGLGIQETSFTCDGLVMGGYYADPEQDCQAYHVCLQVIFIGNLGKISRRAFSPGRRPKPLPSLFPLSKWNSFQPGDLCLRLVVSEHMASKSPQLTPLCQRFNVDCGAAAGLYGAAEGAFGSSGGDSDSDAGECPAPSDGGDCAGAVSNCWSPGQRDTGGRRFSFK